MDERFYIVIISDSDGSRHGLSRRSDGADGPFTGPWRLLDQDEAAALAEAFNADAREATSHADVVEVYRFDNDPVWTEAQA